MTIIEKILRNKLVRATGLLCTLLGSQLHGVGDVDLPEEAEVARIDEGIIHLKPMAIIEGATDVTAELFPEILATMALLYGLSEPHVSTDTTVSLALFDSVRYRAGLLVAAFTKIGMKNAVDDTVKTYNATEVRPSHTRAGLSEVFRWYAEHIGWMKGAMHPITEVGPAAILNIYKDNGNGVFSFKSSYGHYAAWLAVAKFVAEADFDAIQSLAISLKDGDMDKAAGIVDIWIAPVGAATLSVLGKAFVTLMGDRSFHQVYTPLLEASKGNPAKIALDKISPELPWKETLKSSRFQLPLIGAILVSNTVVSEATYAMGLSSEDGPTNFCDREVTSKRLNSLFAEWIARNLFGPGFKLGVRSGIKFDQMHYRTMAGFWGSAILELMGLGPTSWAYNALPEMGDPVNGLCHAVMDPSEVIEKEEL